MTGLAPETDRPHRRVHPLSETIVFAPADQYTIRATLLPHSALGRYSIGQTISVSRSAIGVSSGLDR